MQLVSTNTLLQKVSRAVVPVLERIMFVILALQSIKIQERRTASELVLQMLLPLVQPALKDIDSAQTMAAREDLAWVQEITASPWLVSSLVSFLPSLSLVLFSS